MKTILWVIASTTLLFLLLVFLASAQTNQVVINGDFEVDTSGWIVGVGTLSRTTTVVHTGTGSAQMDLGVFDHRIFRGDFGQCIDLSSELFTWPEVDGKKYIIISAFIKTSANIEDVHVEGLFYTNTTCDRGHLSTLHSPVVYENTGWTQVSVQGEIPATAMSLFVGLPSMGDDTSTVYYDNIQAYSPEIMSEIEVSEGMLDISDDSGDVQFGTTVVGSPITKTFAVSNTGEADLILIEPITVPVGFSIAGSFGDTTLVNSQQTTFTIRLDAVNAGIYSGNLAFDNNDPDENPFNIVISGTVEAANREVYLPLILK